MKIVPALTAAGVLALALAACTSPAGTTPAGGSAGTTPAAGTTPMAAATPQATVQSVADVTSATRAADLRVALNTLLTEHVVLAASATAGALGGRQAQFDGAAAALNQNSADIARAIGSVYGPGAEQAFLPLWNRHIGFFVDYTQATARMDKAGQDKAVADLVQYTQDFGAFLNSANPGLPRDAVAMLVRDHVLTLKDVVDAQAARDPQREFTAIRAAFHHMDMLAEPLAVAIAAQKPADFPGSASSAAVNYRVAVNAGLSEHTYLAARATGAALGGRQAEFEAAAAALDANSVDIAKAIGQAYGPDAERVWLDGWRRHIGFFVDYTQATANRNEAGQQKAVQDLTGYANDTAAFISAANGLPQDTVRMLIMEHILGLKAVVDAQAVGNQPAVYSELRTAFGHMPMLGDPLAEATVKKVPNSFR